MQDIEQEKTKPVRLTSAPVGRLLTSPDFMGVVKAHEEEKKEKERQIEEKREQAKKKKSQNKKKK